MMKIKATHPIRLPEKVIEAGLIAIVPDQEGQFYINAGLAIEVSDNKLVAVDQLPPRRKHANRKNTK